MVVERWGEAKAELLRRLSGVGADFRTIPALVWSRTQRLRRSSIKKGSDLPE